MSIELSAKLPIFGVIFFHKYSPMYALKFWLDVIIECSDLNEDVYGLELKSIFCIIEAVNFYLIFITKSLLIWSDTKYKIPGWIDFLNNLFIQDIRFWWVILRAFYLVNRNFAMTELKSAHVIFESIHFLNIKGEIQF